MTKSSVGFIIPSIIQNQKVMRYKSLTSFDGVAHGHRNFLFKEKTNYVYREQNVGCKASLLRKDHTHPIWKLSTKSTIVKYNLEKFPLSQK